MAENFDLTDDAGIYLGVPRKMRDALRAFAAAQGQSAKNIILYGVIHQIEQGEPVKPVRLRERLAAICDRQEAAA